MVGPISRQANGSRAYAGLQGFVGVYTKITKGALEKYNNVSHTTNDLAVFYSENGLLYIERT